MAKEKLNWATKTENVSALKDTVKRMKGNLQKEQEKIFAKHMQWLLIITGFHICELDCLLKCTYNPQINTHRAFPGWLKTYAGQVEMQSSQPRSTKAMALPSVFSSLREIHQRVKTVGGSALVQEVPALEPFGWNMNPNFGRVSS